jgi:hypothetical protein
MSGDGKTWLDAHFSYISKHAKFFVNEGNSLLNEHDYLKMMSWKGGVDKPTASQGSVPLMLDFSQDTSFPSPSIANINRMFNVKFEGNGIRWRAAANVGAGQFVRLPDPTDKNALPSSDNLAISCIPGSIVGFSVFEPTDRSAKHVAAANRRVAREEKRVAMKVKKQEDFDILHPEVIKPPKLVHGDFFCCPLLSCDSLFSTRKGVENHINDSKHVSVIVSQSSKQTFLELMKDAAASFGTITPSGRWLDNGHLFVDIDTSASLNSHSSSSQFPISEKVSRLGALPNRHLPMFSIGFALQKPHISKPFSQEVKAFLKELYEQGALTNHKFSAEQAVSAMETKQDDDGLPFFSVGEILSSKQISGWFGRYHKSLTDRKIDTMETNGIEVEDDEGNSIVALPWNVNFNI